MAAVSWTSTSIGRSRKVRGGNGQTCRCGAVRALTPPCMCVSMLRYAAEVDAKSIQWSEPERLSAPRSQSRRWQMHDGDHSTLGDSVSVWTELRGSVSAHGSQGPRGRRRGSRFSQRGTRSRNSYGDGTDVDDDDVTTGWPEGSGDHDHHTLSPIPGNGYGAGRWTRGNGPATRGLKRQSVSPLDLHPTGRVRRSMPVATPSANPSAPLASGSNHDGSGPGRGAVRGAVEGLLSPPDGDDAAAQGVIPSSLAHAAGTHPSDTPPTPMSPPSLWPTPSGTQPPLNPEEGSPAEPHKTPATGGRRIGIASGSGAFRAPARVVMPQAVRRQRLPSATSSTTSGSSDAVVVTMSHHPRGSAVAPSPALGVGDTAAVSGSDALAAAVLASANAGQASAPAASRGDSDGGGGGGGDVSRGGLKPALALPPPCEPGTRVASASSGRSRRRRRNTPPSSPARSDAGSMQLLQTVSSLEDSDFAALSSMSSGSPTPSPSPTPPTVQPVPPPPPPGGRLPAAPAAPMLKSPAASQLQQEDGVRATDSGDTIATAGSGVSTTSAHAGPWLDLRDHALFATLGVGAARAIAAVAAVTSRKAGQQPSGADGGRVGTPPPRDRGGSDSGIALVADSLPDADGGAAAARVRGRRRSRGRERSNSDESGVALGATLSHRSSDKLPPSSPSPTAGDYHSPRAGTVMVPHRQRRSPRGSVNALAVTPRTSSTPGGARGGERDGARGGECGGECGGEGGHAGAAGGDAPARREATTPTTPGSKPRQRAVTERWTDPVAAVRARSALTRQLEARQMRAASVHRRHSNSRASGRGYQQRSAHGATARAPSPARRATEEDSSSSGEEEWL